MLTAAPQKIGLALHNYHDIHNVFPSGWIAVRAGVPNAQHGTSGVYRSLATIQGGEVVGEF
jgi:hypothetical protein